ncbi:uncharacterized protein L3040_006353 [Drepanopeziza brunnea f. sp. 'multigermtubi']|uniref:uncharacterized protein n=1 Tax=Drepanopeziza brunnea f. sp. 'multigermtubi' TaxID=698441 RepID=UPI00238D992A|nr:hypothetical protein L3040_006353 [Drepanopeziza brunnea f. sp. 'multigermtubi']
MPSSAIPPRHILAIAVVGRRTHLTPVLEICEVLHSYGHKITIAGMEGQIHNLPSWASNTISVCHAMDDKAAQIHHELCEAVATERKGLKAMAATLTYFDSFYPEIHRNLKPILAPRTGPEKIDFVIADFFEIAAIDLALEFNIPYATSCTQISFPLGFAPGIAGIPGQQQTLMNTENATLVQRTRETWIALCLLSGLLPFIRNRLALRAQNTKIKDRAHISFINSFMGLETPVPLDPLVCPVGPLMKASWAPLTPEFSTFLEARSSVVYIGFGTLASMTLVRFTKLRDTIRVLLQSGHIDGAIWSIKKIPAGGEPSAPTKEGSDDDLLAKDSNIMMVPFAPQRAILEHPSVKLFISHAGAQSTHEAIFHGVLMLCMPIFGDHYPYALRCEENGGMALRLDKHDFTVAEAVHKARLLLEDREGTFGMNSRRMQMLSVVRQRVGPLEAAAKVLEVLFDHELRLVRPGGLEMKGKMALEPPGKRMGWWKRGGWDMVLLGPFVALYLGIGALFNKKAS